MIKTIIFDLGGVIVDENKAKTFKHLAQNYNLDVEELRDAYEKYLPRYDCGKIGKEEFINLISNEIDKKIDANDFFNIYLKNVIIRNNVLDFIKSLKGKYKLVVLSNANEFNIKNIFKNISLEEIFDYLFYSYQIKMLKPNKEIYEYVLRRLKVKAEECFFIDDKIENINGAKSIGIKGIVYKDLEQIKNELVSLSVLGRGHESMMKIDRDWEKVYEDKATPWDVYEPEDALVKLIKDGFVKPCRVLEIGCGHGNDAIFLAKNGFDVSAIDISKKAIETAKRRAKKANAKCKFLIEDITKLKSLSGNFDFVYDRACFHFIPKDKRDNYLKNLKKLLIRDGWFVLIVSSDKETPKGPYQFSKKDINQIFGKDFDIKEIRMITLKQHKEKPKPYLCIMKRK